MHTETIHYVIIDDHPDIRDGVKYYIGKHAGFQLSGEFDNIRSALNERLNTSPKVMILDLNLDGVDALKYVPQLQQRFPGCGIIAYTQHHCTQKELEFLGVRGYIDKKNRAELLEAMQVVANGGNYFTISKSVDNNIYADVYAQFKKLSRRQLEVAELIYHHLTNKEIGKRLYLSPATIETHRKTIKKMLQTESREAFYSMLRTYFDIPENTCWPDGLPAGS